MRPTNLHPSTLGRPSERRMLESQTDATILVGRLHYSHPEHAETGHKYDLAGLSNVHKYQLFIMDVAFRYISRGCMFTDSSTAHTWITAASTRVVSGTSKRQKHQQLTTRLGRSSKLSGDVNSLRGISLGQVERPEDGIRITQFPIPVLRIFPIQLDEQDYKKAGQLLHLR